MLEKYVEQLDNRLEQFPDTKESQLIKNKIEE